MYWKTYVSDQTNTYFLILQKCRAKTTIWTKWDRYNMK